jgi:hypothetical protein
MGWFADQLGIAMVALVFGNLASRYAAVNPYLLFQQTNTFQQTTDGIGDRIGYQVVIEIDPVDPVRHATA